MSLQVARGGRLRRWGEPVRKIRKYLRENPNRWNEQSNNILYNVLFSHCLRLH
jgi:hypothetical protein